MCSKAADIRQVGYVPDAGHARLIARCKADNDIRDVVLSTEEEGVALAAGAWLGGQRSALLMQSSGVGNCINMLSLISACRFPFLTFITMRGEWAEFNPWQVPMSQAVEPVLAATGVKVYRVNSADEVAETAQAAADLGVRRRPRGRGAALAEDDRPQGVGEVMLDRRKAIATLMANRPKDLFVVPGLGSTTYDMASLGEKDSRFLSLGRDGRRRDDRARPRAGEAEREGRGDHRRRRDADGHGLARHHRRAAAGESRDRSCSTTSTTARPACRRATPTAASTSSASRAPAASGRRSTVQDEAGPEGARRRARRAQGDAVCARAHRGGRADAGASLQGRRGTQAALPQGGRGRRIGAKPLQTRRFRLVWTGRNRASITARLDQPRPRGGARRPGSSVGRARD